MFGCGSALDWGYDLGRAWVDFNGDGRADYCRVVGGDASQRVQCTVSGGDSFGVTYTSPALDWGYTTNRVWVDFNGDGRADYCRRTGESAGGNTHVTCTMSTGSGFGVTVNSPALDWGYDLGRAWAGSRIPESPGVPQAPTVAAGDGVVNVSWTAPGSGGAPIDSFAVSASPGDAGCSGPAGVTSCTVGGLGNGTAYTVRVRAHNSVGWSAWSQPSSTVVPTAPVVSQPPAGQPPATGTTGGGAAGGSPAPTASATRPPSAAPVTITTVTSKGRTATVKYVAATPAKKRKYQVRISKPNSVKFRSWRTTKKTHVKYTGLRKGAGYTVEVRLKTGKTTSASAAANFTQR